MFDNDLHKPPFKRIEKGQRLSRLDDPRDSKIERLEEELWLTGIQLILTRPEPVVKLLRYGQAKNWSELNEWRLDVIDKTMDIAREEIQSRPKDGEQRIKCPLCGQAPGSKPMGFLLGGLRTHLDDNTGSSDCFVLARAIKNIIYQNKHRWSV